jgi:hypothetical protein
MRAWGSVVVKALRYWSEGPGIDPRSIFFPKHPTSPSAWGSTLPLKMSTRVKTAGAYSWRPYHLHVPSVYKSGSLNLLEPSRPRRPVTGILYLLTSKKKTLYLTVFLFFFFFPFWVLQLMLPEAPQPYGLLYYPRIGHFNFLHQLCATTPPEQRKLEL